MSPRLKTITMMTMTSDYLSVQPIQRTNLWLAPPIRALWILLLPLLIVGDPETTPCLII